MFKILTVFGVVLLSTYNIGHSYNWQKHIPEEAKQYIPDLEDEDESSANISLGVANLKGKVSLTNHKGPLSLTQARVTGPINVFGPLTAHQTDFEDLVTVHGPVKLTGKSEIYNQVKSNVQVFGPVFAKWMIFNKPITVFGFLEATHCIFEGSLTIHTNKLILKDCTIRDLEVNDHEGKPVEIELDNVRLSGFLKVKSGLGTLSLKNMTLDENKVSGIAKIHK